MFKLVVRADGRVGQRPQIHPGIGRISGVRNYNRLQSLSAFRVDTCHDLNCGLGRPSVIPQSNNPTILEIKHKSTLVILGKEFCVERVEL